LWGREESEEKGAGERVASKDLSSGTVQLYQLSRWGGWEGLEGPCCAREGVRKGSRGMEGKDGGRLTSKERITTRTPHPRALCNSSIQASSFAEEVMSVQGRIVRRTVELETC
jgi:hypothetical protein